MLGPSTASRIEQYFLDSHVTDLNINASDSRFRGYFEDGASTF